MPPPGVRPPPALPLRPPHGVATAAKKENKPLKAPARADASTDIGELAKSVSSLAKSVSAMSVASPALPGPKEPANEVEPTKAEPQKKLEQPPAGSEKVAQVKADADKVAAPIIETSVPPPVVASPVPAKLPLDFPRRIPVVPPDGHENDPDVQINIGFMEKALDMARLALKTNETPVGCILVYRGRVIAQGMNATNQTRNGTRHAELLAINALISYTPAALKSKLPPALDDWWLSTEAQPLWDAVDPSKGRTYPYGWKLHPAPIVTPDIIRECTLYVTVEPCVMCASMLRQYRIGRVYFGAVNDKFGGTGGVFRIHKNSTPLPPSLGYYKPPDYVPPRPGTSSSTATKTTVTTPNGTFAVADETQDGDGGNIEPGYPVYGGWGRDEAVSLLRRFYVQENGRAPVPRKKEGRAARLAAMVNANGGGAADADAADTTDSGNAASGVGSPADLTEPTTLSGMLHDKDTKEYMANAPVQESAFAAPSGKENTNLRAL